MRCRRRNYILVREVEELASDEKYAGSYSVTRDAYKRML